MSFARSMRKVIVSVLFGCLLVIPAAAQTGQKDSPADPASSWLRNIYKGNRNNIARAAEKMPEEFYGLRPGPQMEVRTYGQIIGHLANFNYMWCAQAKGEKDPNQGNDFEKLTKKADLLKAINSALTYCDGVYAALTDASGMQMVDVTQENGRQQRVLRMSLLNLNVFHNNEHYGNIVTYLRIKSIVPPSSEPAQPQR
jgi:uncharacterized damage-inducible protein DinB